MSGEPADLATATLLVGTAIAGVELWPALAFICTTVELGAGFGAASDAVGRENEAAMQILLCAALSLSSRRVCCREGEVSSNKQLQAVAFDSIPGGGGHCWGSFCADCSSLRSSSKCAFCTAGLNSDHGWAFLTTIGTAANVSLR
jgi:hypothetical protein